MSYLNFSSFGILVISSVSFPFFHEVFKKGGFSREKEESRADISAAFDVA